MKKIICKVATCCSMILLLTAFIFTVKVKAEGEGQRVYSVTPEDSKWEQLGNVENKIEACAISNQILAEMSTEELIDAVLEYPFITDLFLANDYKKAVESMEENSDAFCVLLAREDAKESIIKWIEKRKNSSLKITAEEELQNEEMMILLMYSEKLVNQITRDDWKILDGFSSIISVEFDEPDNEKNTVQTPKGTIVPHIAPSCSHSNSNFHSQLDSEVVAT